MTAFYNDKEKFVVQWLRNLVAAGKLPGGVVDGRGIEELSPEELSSYDECHFFAGIGGWPLALHQAGGTRGLRIWTGSCPCQPFSLAGKRQGFDDERHIWPVWFSLIKECKPDVIFGEQVSSPDALRWLDAVFDDLESAGYACTALDLCASSVGAPHIRQRLYWVAYADHGRRLGLSRSEGRETERLDAIRAGETGSVANASSARFSDEGNAIYQFREETPPANDARPGETGSVADSNSERCDGERILLQPGRQGEEDAKATGSSEANDRRGDFRPVGGFWRDADWLYCRDDKWRPVEPGTFPLVDGFSGRMGRLRAYGNAIVVPLAATFIRAFFEAINDGAI